jgi:hypothetical protein
MIALKCTYGTVSVVPFVLTYVSAVDTNSALPRVLALRGYQCLLAADGTGVIVIRVEVMLARFVTYGTYTVSPYVLTCLVAYCTFAVFEVMLTFVTAVYTDTAFAPKMSTVNAAYRANAALPLMVAVSVTIATGTAYPSMLAYLVTL